MTYISTREGQTGTEADGSGGGSSIVDESGDNTQTTVPLKLTELDIDERYLDIMSAEYEDADDFISDCNGFALADIPCIGMTRKHGLHEQLNTIITRLNAMEKLLAAIARNTQAITCTKTIVGEE